MFCDTFPPIMDGVTVCMENYARWIQKKHGGAVVVTPAVKNADYSGYDFDIFNFFSVPVPKRHPYVIGLSEVDPTFKKKLSETRFKIVHAHCPFITGQTALKVAKQQGIPCIGTFHSKFRDDFSQLLPDIIVDQVIKYIINFFESCDQVWVPQESVIDVIREYGYKGRVEVVDNGSDLVGDYPEAYFDDARGRLGIAPGELVLLFVGQHIWQKNTRLIIDTLSKIQDIPFRMYFVGDGYAAKDMKELVSSYGLDSKVTFVGTIHERERIVDYYAAADLFLFPSLYDNAPLVVREAAALHTPSVMAKGATASTILTDGENGFLTDDNADSMAAKLRELAADPERIKRVGRRASRSIVRSWEDCVDEAVDRYNALLRSKGLPAI